MDESKNKDHLATLYRQVDDFNEFVILLMGQHKYDVMFSNGCPTGALAVGAFRINLKC